MAPPTIDPVDSWTASTSFSDSYGVSSASTDDAAYVDHHLAETEAIWRDVQIAQAQVRHVPAAILVVVSEDQLGYSLKLLSDELKRGRGPAPPPSDIVTTAPEGVEQAAMSISRHCTALMYVVSASVKHVFLPIPRHVETVIAVIGGGEYQAALRGGQVPRCKITMCECGPGPDRRLCYASYYIVPGDEIRMTYAKAAAEDRGASSGAAAAVAPDKKDKKQEDRRRHRLGRPEEASSCCKSLVVLAAVVCALAFALSNVVSAAAM